MTTTESVPPAPAPSPTVHCVHWTGDWSKDAWSWLVPTNPPRWDASIIIREKLAQPNTNYEKGKKNFSWCKGELSV